MPDFNFITTRTVLPNTSEINFDFGSTLFNILAGSSNTITAIWADIDAGRSCGRVYVASYGDGAAFSVVDLNTKLLYDRYTDSIKGRANQVLKQNDLKDIMV